MNAQDLAQQKRADDEARSERAAESATAKARAAAIEAEVVQLGEHRRAEAERLVDMREAAEAARRGSVRFPAYVATPRMPETTPPPGYFDSNQFVRVDDPSEARVAYEQLYGTHGGSAQYLSEGCYPDGSGHFNCQARVRSPLSSSGRAKPQ